MNLGRGTGLRPNGHVLFVQTPEYIVGITAVPGPHLVAVLLDPATGNLIALRRVQEAARVAREATGT